MIIVLHGLDQYRLQQRITTLRSAFTTKYDTQQLGQSVAYGGETPLATVRQMIASGGLFSTKRFVVIQDVFSYTKTDSTQLLEILERVPIDTIVVATTKELPKIKSALRERLLQADKIEQFNLLTDSETTQWIKEWLKPKAVSISSEAMVYLVQTVGNNLWQLENILQQCIHYTSAITKETVTQFVQAPFDDNMFHFTDALIQGKTALALRLFHEQLASGQAPQYLIAVLARQLATLARIKDGKVGEQDLHPFVVKKMKPQATKLSAQTIADLLNQLFNIDLQIKTTGLDPVAGLDQLILQWTKKTP